MMKASARGVLVALHLLAISVGALPVIVDERALTPEVWKDPLAQREFDRFSQILGGLGIRRSPEETGRHLWDLASAVLHTQRALQRPFQGYYREAGTRQRWRMFPSAIEETPRFRIDVERGGNWETWYRMGDPLHAWGREHFDRDRVRAALNLYAWGLYPESYEALVDWIAARVPEADRVRVGFEMVPALAPDAAATARVVREEIRICVRDLPSETR
jgi:hypothetical protein